MCTEIRRGADLAPLRQVPRRLAQLTARKAARKAARNAAFSDRPIRVCKSTITVEIPNIENITMIKNISAKTLRLELCKGV